MLSFFLQTIIPDSVKNLADTVTNAVSGINPGTTEKGDDAFSVFSMLVNGGPMMIPIGVLFGLALFIWIDRLIVISKASKKNAQLLGSIAGLVNKGDIDSARAMCKMSATPENVMLDKGLSRIGNPAPEIKEAMDTAGKVELGRLERRLGILNIIGRIAPMFGFIGTIFGVIKIFFEIAQAKTVNIEVISTGLYQKMVCSAGGLVVGVLAFVCYHWMMSLIDKLALRLEESQMKFMDILQEPSKTHV
ncbi:MAG: MotA/TolQ/ExbB proton channel family protein [Bacteroidia bacterium]|nr:MotA/TolQ/ExbB proton channel family protein [Bacteroidia bacterium]